MCAYSRVGDCIFYMPKYTYTINSIGNISMFLHKICWGQGYPTQKKELTNIYGRKTGERKL